MRRIVTTGLVIGAAFWGVARAANPPAQPAADPPELKRTVDAFAGRWKLQTTMTPPDGKPVKVAETVECKKAVMNKAATCIDRSTIPGMGPTEYAYLVGYDVDTKLVHLFAVGSQGEVHDHKCTWKDEKTLECEPLKATLGGSPITEEITFSWPDAKTLNLSGKITTKDGVVQIAATGKR